MKWNKMEREKREQFNSTARRGTLCLKVNQYIKCTVVWYGISRSVTVRFVIYAQLYNVMLCFILCYVMSCYVILCYIMRCNVLLLFLKYSVV